MKRIKTTHFRILGMFVLIAGLTFTSCKDSSTSAYDEKDMITSAQSVGDMMNDHEISNVYISDSNTDTYDPLFPATALSDWETSVCYQGNSFGINATWSNSHKAFEVGTHPWESGTFNANWINAVNTMDSNLTKDSNNNSGPGGVTGQDQNSGHNWTRYDKQVAGNGDFSIQLLADNCSWVYLADEDGSNPELIGYQAVTSTPGNYGVELNGNHTLIFIIYDGGGSAGGKFRLETTENPPPPIEPEEPEVITYTSQAGIKTWEPILEPRDSDFKNLQCVDAGPNVIGLDDSRWVRTNNTAYSVRGLLPSNYNNEFTFERAWNGRYGLSNFDAEWINAKNTPWSVFTFPSDYSGPFQYYSSPKNGNGLPYDSGNGGTGTANWTRYELPVDGNGTFELKLLADDCSWIYLDNQLIGYQDDSDLDTSDLTYGVTLNGPATLSFIVFDQGGEAGGKFILQTTTEVVPPYEPPTPVNNAPVANAGSDQSITATGQTTPVTLDGSGSSDPDGDTLTYSWTLNGSEVSTDESPALNLADGSYTLTLTVSDGELSDSDDVNVTVVNTVPVANAGGDITKNATGQTTPVNLDGSASDDADGDALTYSWTLDGEEVANTETATIELPDGDYVITLVVSDGQGASSSDDVDVSVVNTVPVANAGADVTTEATGSATSVTLTGSGTDADGDDLTYSWSNGDSGTSTTVELGVGVHTFTLTVSDGQGASHSDEVEVEITDTTAPVLSVNKITGILWPPNHKMVLVATGISASDIVDGATDVTVTVISSEASNGKGDGNTDSDWEVVDNADGSQDVYVRSERSGKGNGRIYTISMTTVDSEENESSDSFEVQVVHNQGNGRGK